MNVCLSMGNNQNNPKNWWVPVWKGLVIDPESKHQKRMKNALWLFLYLLLNADRKTGVLQRKLKTISSDTGIKERTIRVWLRLLKNQGYIETKNKGHCLFIRIKKWKSLSACHDNDTQNGKNLPGRVAESCRGENDLKSQNFPQLGQKPVDDLDPNDITIKKDIKNNDIDNNNSFDLNSNSFKEFEPRNRKERLALDLAKALNDPKGLALYISYSNKYPENLLRKTLGVVNKIPDEKIKKSRGALFNYLIQKHAQKTSQNLSD